MTRLPAQRSKTALVLAGGGVAGAVYEIGALCAIDDLLEQRSVNDFDLYVGTSAGALVAACLANGISPRSLLAVVDGAAFGIDQLEPHHVFAWNLPDAVQRGLRLPGSLIEVVRQRPALRALTETLTSGLPTGIYDPASLEHYLRAVLEQPGRSNSFAGLPHELLVIATNLDSGERAVFGQPPYIDVSIAKAVSASAALPLFYRPVQIGAHTFIDGGIRGTASIDLAIERGAQLIVCINPLVPYDNARLPIGRSIGDAGIRHIGNQVFRTFVHAGLHYHLKQIRRQHPNVDIIVIEPRRDDAVMFRETTMSYAARLSIARHSFATVASHLCDHAVHYQELLARHGISSNPARPTQALQALQNAGSDLRAVRAALATGGRLHAAPAGLDQTLGELDRILTRMAGNRTRAVNAPANLTQI